MSRKLNLQWWCDTRVDISLDLLELMHEAGCTWVSIGVEAGSPAMLEEISKRISLDQVVAFIDRCKQFDIGVNMLMMVSHPNETLAEVEQMRYLFGSELEFMLGQAGLRMTGCEEWMTGRPPGPDTWGV